MKVLVTGGAGYVGYSLVQRLLEHPEVEEVTVFDNLSRRNYNFLISGKLQGQKLRFVTGELLDTRLLEREVQRADAVYHLAAKVLTPFADIDSHFFEQVNHWGTAGLVNLVEQSDCTLFVYLSSVSVYGRVETAATEESELHPESFYGVSKKRGEDHVKRLAEKGIRTHILRSGNVYGFNPCIRFDAVLNKFMLDAAVNGKLSIHGNGEQHRAFIHVDKLAHTLAALIDQEIPGLIHNLAEHNLTVHALVAAVEQVYPDLERIYINQHLQMRELQVQVPARITEHIPLPERTLEEELTDFRQHWAW